jgi:DHA2 family multidrug resistance protein-like MFS transporter
VLIAFVRRQRKLPVPLLDVTLFRNRAFSVAVGSVLLVMTSLVGLGLLFAQYLQLVLALQPMQAALRLLFVMVAAVIGSIVAGPLLQWWGNRRATVAGFVVSAAALASAAAGLTVTENLWLLGPVLAATGFGVSVSLTAASDALLAAAPAEQAGAAAAVEETAYELGAGLGVTILGSVATMIYTASLPGTASQARDGLTEATAAAAGLPPEASAQLLELARAAFVTGMRAALVAGAVLFVLATIAAARALPKSKEPR